MICFGFVDNIFGFVDNFFRFVDKLVMDLLMLCFGLEEARRAKRRPEGPKEGLRTKGGPKGLRLEVGAWRAPKLLVLDNDIFVYIGLDVCMMRQIFHAWTNLDPDAYIHDACLHDAYTYMFLDHNACT